jgi:cupin fold WbuC family metalloprotein
MDSLLKNFNEVSDGVFYSTDKKTKIDIKVIKELSAHVGKTKLRRARICAHLDEEDDLQEMFVAVEKGSFIRPHKHLTKCESLSVIEGTAIAIFFHDSGSISDAFYIGRESKDHRFYYRISSPIFHMLIIISELFVFHEATTGPFRREDSVYSPWSPDEKDKIACEKYIESIRSLALERIDQSS